MRRIPRENARGVDIWRVCVRTGRYEDSYSRVSSAASCEIFPKTDMHEFGAVLASRGRRTTQRVTVRPSQAPNRVPKCE